MDGKALIGAAYLLGWLLLFLFASPKKRKWRIGLFLLLFLLTPFVYLREYRTLDADVSSADPIGLVSRYTSLTYQFGPFLAVELINHIDLSPKGFGGMPTYILYYHLFSSDPEFAFPEIFIPCLFYLAFFLALMLLLVAAKRRRNTYKVPISRIGKATWLIILPGLICLTLYAQLSMDKLRWPYFTAEMLVLGVLTVLALQLRSFPGKYAWAAFLLFILLFPLPAPRARCLCGSILFSNFGYDQKETKLYPFFAPTPVALYLAAQAPFPEPCPCYKAPDRDAYVSDRLKVFLYEERPVIFMTLFGILLFVSVLVKSGVVPPLLNSEDTGEENNDHKKNDQ